MVHTTLPEARILPGRYLIPVAITIAAGMILGFRVTTNPIFRFRRLPAASRLRPGHVLGIGPHRMLVKTPQGVQAFGFIAFFPLVFGSNLLAPTRRARRLRAYPDRAPSMRWYTQESNTSSASRMRDGSAAVSAAARFGYCPVAAALTIDATCAAWC